MMKTFQLDLSIILVNFNSSEYLSRCLDSLISVIKGISFEMIVVDNFFSVEENRRVRKITDDRGVLLISLQSNSGFSIANNIAAKRAHSENILFLNPDVIIVSDWMTDVVSFLKTNTRSGVCGAALMNSNGTIEYSAGNKCGLWFEISEAFFFINITRKFFFNRVLSAEVPVKVEWVSGAFLFVRKSVFLTVNGFNPDFFLNYEDIDLCTRIRSKGFDNYYFPKIKNIHLDHKSFGQDFDKLVFTRYESRLIFWSAHYGKIQRIVVIIIHVVGLLMRLFFTNLYYSGEERKSRLRGYIRALRLYLSLSNHRPVNDNV